jgi:membrane protein YqaA with SNARE-associated domain
MFGFTDIWILLAYGLSAVGTMICIVYGFVRWNKD